MSDKHTQFKIDHHVLEFIIVKAITDVCIDGHLLHILWKWIEQLKSTLEISEWKLIT